MGRRANVSPRTTKRMREGSPRCWGLQGRTHREIRGGINNFGFRFLLTCSDLFFSFCSGHPRHDDERGVPLTSVTEIFNKIRGRTSSSRRNRFNRASPQFANKFCDLRIAFADLVSSSSLPWWLHFPGIVSNKMKSSQRKTQRASIGGDNATPDGIESLSK